MFNWPILALFIDKRAIFFYIYIVTEVPMLYTVYSIFAFALLLLASAGGIMAFSCRYHNDNASALNWFCLSMLVALLCCAVKLEMIATDLHALVLPPAP